MPEDLHHVEKWRLALEMIDELMGWGIDPPPVLADGAYGDNTEFREGLQQHGISYVLDVKTTTSAYPEHVRPEQPAYQGRGQPPKSRYRQAPSCLKDLALAAGRQATVEVCWREGTRGEMTSRFLALRVRPENIQLRRQAHSSDEELQACWLLCEWPENKEEPVKYWLSNLPADTDTKTLVGLGKLRWRIEHAGPVPSAAESCRPNTHYEDHQPNGALLASCRAHRRLSTQRMSRPYQTPNRAVRGRIA